MTTALTVLACDTQALAQEAHQFLIQSGYTDADITTEQVTNFTYDAEKYDGGSNESLLNKFIVIGRMP